MLNWYFKPCSFCRCNPTQQYQLLTCFRMQQVRIKKGTSADIFWWRENSQESTFMLSRYERKDTISEQKQSKREHKEAGTSMKSHTRTQKNNNKKNRTLISVSPKFIPAVSNGTTILLLKTTFNILQRGFDGLQKHSYMSHMQTFDPVLPSAYMWSDVICWVVSVGQRCGLSFLPWCLRFSILNSCTQTPCDR